MSLDFLRGQGCLDWDSSFSCVELAAISEASTFEGLNPICTATALCP